jgi:hypothetical protein
MELEVEKNSSEAILETVRDYISGCKKALANRYVDNRAFERTAAYIDWTTLVKKLNSFPQK